MAGNMLIEVVLRKGDDPTKYEKFQQVIKDFLSTELDNKIVLNFPLNWSGFKEGTLNEMWRTFDEMMYIALAYIPAGTEVVTDIYGDPVDNYDTTIDGKKVKKYVKKNLRIIDILNKEDNRFEMESYIVDLRVSPPVIKILDVYSGSKESGLSLNQFLSGNR